MRSISLSVLAVAAMLATACASNPEPEPTPPPLQTTVVTPPPRPPVQPQQPPAAAGPQAGSKADFAGKNTDRIYFGYDQYKLDATARARCRVRRLAEAVRRRA